MRLLVPPVNDQISDIRDPGERVGENDHMMLVVKNRIQQQQQRTGEAQPPKQNRHDHLLLFFGRIPLHQKTREKNRVTQPADNRPENDPVHNFSLIESELDLEIESEKNQPPRRQVRQELKP